MKTFSIFFLLSLSSCTYRLPSKELFKSKCKTENYFVFINGMNVEYEDTSLSRDSLEIKSSQKFDLLYNTKENATRDLAQAIRQKSEEASKEGNGTIKTWIMDSAASLALGRESIYTPDELIEIARVSKELEETKTIVVSHSQGNLFANLLCEKSIKKPKTIHIANPSSLKTECEISNITFDNDPVISAIRFAAKTEKSMEPREAIYHFKRGNKISSKEEISLMKNETKIQRYLSELFYNHDFESYLEREPTSSRKILSDIKKLSTKNDPVAFDFIIHYEGLPNQVIIFNNQNVSHSYKAKCSEFAGLKDQESLSVSLSLNIAGLVNSNQLVIKEGKAKFALRENSNGIQTMGTIRKTILSDGNFELTLTPSTIEERAIFKIKEVGHSASEMMQNL